jgi:heterodisulfide reductase subunit A
MCSECLQCVSVCQAKAIDHTQKAEHLDIKVGSVVLAPGFDGFDARLKGEYGYGRMPNVVTSLEFERILSASGPYQVRSSGLRTVVILSRSPGSSAWVRAIRAVERTIAPLCAVCMLPRKLSSPGNMKTLSSLPFSTMISGPLVKASKDINESAKEKFGVRYINSIPSMVKELQKSHNLLLEYTDDSGKKVQEEFDMVVLSIGLVPSKGTKELQKESESRSTGSGSALPMNFTQCYFAARYLCGRRLYSSYRYT